MNKSKTKHYANFHAHLKRKFGKALKCENKECTFDSPKRFEWALLKGKEYSKNPNDYIQLCVSCHRRYDFTEQQRSRMSASHTGKINPKSQGSNHFKSKPIIQCDLIGNEIRRWDSVNRCAVETGLIKQSILKCLHKTMNQTKGFTFQWYTTTQQEQKQL